MHVMGEPELEVIRRGAGPPVLLIHGAAADRKTWSLALGTLKEHFTALAYDRRAQPPHTTQAHAADAAAILRRELPASTPALVCGASYGAVIALELAAAAPELVAGLVLGEPPLPPGPTVPSAPPGFGCAFDRLVATAGGPAAAEMFLRAALGDAAFADIPPQFRPVLCATWRQIRADMTALNTYAVDLGRLGAITAPALLLTGARSPAFYGAGVDLLAGVLPRARRDVVPGGGHAMHFDAHRAWAARVIDFARAIGFL
jgi:pimeloyl-ACP methyl ester carboxylesterase